MDAANEDLYQRSEEWDLFLFLMPKKERKNERSVPDWIASKSITLSFTVQAAWWYRFKDWTDTDIVIRKKDKAKEQKMESKEKENRCFVC